MSPTDLPTRSKMLPEVVEWLCSLLVGRRGAGCSRRSSSRPHCSLIAESARGTLLDLVSPRCSLPLGQRADEKEGLLVHHWLGVYLLYALVIVVWTAPIKSFSSSVQRVSSPKLALSSALMTIGSFPGRCSRTSSAWRLLRSCWPPCSWMG